MRPKSITVTSANSPCYVPVSYRRGPVGINAKPAGGATYAVEYCRGDIQNSDLVDMAWVSVGDMESDSAIVESATCLKLTLSSGDSVAFEIAQSDA